MKYAGTCSVEFDSCLSRKPTIQHETVCSQVDSLASGLQYAILVRAEEVDFCAVDSSELERESLILLEIVGPLEAVAPPRSGGPSQSCGLLQQCGESVRRVLPACRWHAGRSLLERLHCLHCLHYSLGRIMTAPHSFDYVIASRIH